MSSLAVVSAALWVVSSLLWGWSAMMPSPFAKITRPKTISISTDGPFIMGGVDWEKAISYFNSQSRANFWAALVSAIAALTAGLAAAGIG